MFVTNHFKFLVEAVALLVLAGTFLHAQEKADEALRTFAGRISDTNGNPVTDALISVQGKTKYASVKTDENGNFEFGTDIPPGEYEVRIESTECVGITDFRNLVVIEIVEGKTTEKDFELKRACRFEVLVVDEEGDPVRASVYVKAVGDESPRNAEQFRVDRNGIATVGGFDPKWKMLDVGISSETHGAAKTSVTIDNLEELTRHKIVLKKGETVQATIICSDGLPASGWKLYALPEGWNFGTYSNPSTIGDDGEVEIQHVVPGRYDLLVFIPMGGGMSSSRSVASGIDLVEAVKPIQLRLDYPSPKSLNYLEGDVRWIGRPLEENGRGINISGYSLDTRQHVSFFLEPGKKTFRLGPMPKGIYRISVDSPEIEVLNLRKIEGLDDLEHFMVPSDKRLQLALRFRGKPFLQGVVLDSESKQPIDRFRYRATKLATLSGPNYVQDDKWHMGADGKFRIEVTGPGIFQVHIQSEGFAIAKGNPINTEEQEDEIQSIVLSRGISLRGRVVDSNGEPVNDAIVRALSLSTGAMPRVMNLFATYEGAVKTKDGYFEIKDLAEGTDTLRVDHPDFAFQVIPDIEITESGSQPKIVLESGATVFGRVYDADGNPNPHETLFFYNDYAYGGGDREAGKFGQVTTDEDGSYELEHLPETTVFVSRDNEWSASGMVRHAVFTKLGERHQLDFGGQHRLTGVLVANGFQPLANTRVQLSGEDSTFSATKMYTTTDNEGRFTFFGPPAGIWKLYRSLNDRNSEWSEFARVVVEPEVDSDLGTIQLRIGTFTVRCKPAAGAIPDGLMLQLRKLSPYAFFGRTAAVVRPREHSQAPFVFDSVSPGQLELAAYVKDYH
ncbi:MAG: carboxypeptidase regulatory-like domain-containing protein [Planctomycetales bacterium]|nr:carboxypeptidase regulatory-like domain-containing protein [Planctomycetales bacterium]